MIRNLQTLTESSQRLSDGMKATEPQVPWRELAGFRNVIDLPPLAAALDRMAARSGAQG